MLWETDVVLIVRVTALKFNKLCSFPYDFHSDTEVSALILLLGFRVTSFLPLPALLKLASVALERPWRGPGEACELRWSQCPAPALPIFFSNGRFSLQLV